MRLQGEMIDHITGRFWAIELVQLQVHSVTLKHSCAGTLSIPLRFGTRFHACTTVNVGSEFAVLGICG